MCQDLTLEVGPDLCHGHDRGMAPEPTMHPRDRDCTSVTVAQGPTVIVTEGVISLFLFRDWQTAGAQVVHKSTHWHGIGHTGPLSPSESTDSGPDDTRVVSQCSLES